MNLFYTRVTRLGGSLHLRGALRHFAMAQNGHTDLDLKKLVRPNIFSLEPYRCARDENKGKQGVLMDANENGYGPCLEDVGELHRYPCPYQPELKAQIASFRGMTPDQIFLGVGSDEAIDMIMRVFCKPGHHSILVTPPTYGMYKVSAAINDVAVQKVNLTPDFQLEMENVLSAVTDNTRVIFLCSPCNPTGTTLRQEDIQALLESPRFDGIVVLDEAYVDFSSKGSLSTLVDRYPRLIVMQTLSKSFGLAGIRLGWAIAHESIVAIFNKVKAPYNISRQTAELARKAMDNVSVMQATAAKLMEHRQGVMEELEAMPGVLKVFPSDTNFVMVKVAPDAARGIYDSMANRGVLIRYRGEQVHCEGCLRITICRPEDNRLALDLLADELRKIQEGAPPPAKRSP